MNMEFWEEESVRLERCPYFRGFLIEGFHCTHVHILRLFVCELTFGGVAESSIAVDGEAVQEVILDKVMDEVMQGAVLAVRVCARGEGGRGGC